MISGFTKKTLWIIILVQEQKNNPVFRIFEKKMENFGITVLGSGSSGNASVIHAPEGHFLLDAGFSARELEKRMCARKIDPSSINAVLISHEHTDHTKGCRVFADRYGIASYMTSTVSMACRRGNLLPEKNVLFVPGESFPLCGLTVETFTLPHDALDTVGFTFTAPDGRKIGVATDLGHVNTLTLHIMSGCGILMLESNHDPDILRASDRAPSLKRRILSRHGHLSNNDALEALALMIQSETRHLILAHISRECNNFELVETLASGFLQNTGRNDIVLDVARPDEPLPTRFLF